MPPSKEPELDTPEAIWASELRYYRERAGLSQDELADKVGWSRSTIQHAETTRRPTEDVVKACDAALNADGVLIRLREKLFKRLALNSSFRSWMPWEQDATALRGYESVLVPGLLQTAEYALLILRGNHDAVATRMERQAATLDKDDAPTVRYVIDEWVLRRPVGGPQVMVPQLEFIEQSIAQRNVKVQISPSGSVPQAHGSFLLATVNDETVAFEESSTDGFLLTKRYDIRFVEEMYDALLAEALPTAASLQAIRRIKEEWEQQA